MLCYLVGLGACDAAWQDIVIFTQSLFYGSVIVIWMCILYFTLQVSRRQICKLFNSLLHTNLHGSEL